MTLEREVRAPRTFSFAEAPYSGVLRRLHLVHEDGTLRTWHLVLIAWLPLCVGALARMLVGERPQPILFDISVHTRLLVGIPVVVMAARLLDMRCRSAIEQLYECNLAEPEQLDRIVDRAERLRDSRLAGIAIVVLALLAGEAVLWQLAGSTGMFAGVTHAGDLSFARLWYSFIALPLLQFLLLRWMWHWVIWSYVVIHLSRLRLAVVAMHPDHAAGLSFLSSPINAFAVFTFGVSSVMAGAWGTQILRGDATMHAFVPSFVAFVIVVAIVACTPQLAYIGQLYKARHYGTRHYHPFALEYVRDFHRKWLIRPASDELGSQDIQALNDLGGAYATLDRTRLVPAGPRAVAGLWIAALIPMLPLVVTAVPIGELVEHLGHAMLGGIPL